MKKDFVVTTTVIALAALASLAQAAQSSTPAPAQAPSSQPPAAAEQEPKPSPPPVTAGWRDGFYIQSEKADFRLQLGALVHADGRFAPGDDDSAIVDTFLIRRVRPYLRGRIAQRFEFYVNPDFAGGTVVVQDAYIDTIFSPAFRVRVGKGKSPFGLERLQPVSSIMFFERALPTSLVPNRDVGVHVLGDVSGGLVSYSAGVMNGVVDGGSADQDTGDSKDVLGRILVRPFSKRAESGLRGLSVGIAASAGRQTGAGALPTLRTASLQQTYFAYSGASADGVRTRYSPHLSYTRTSFAGFAEYVHTELPVRRGAVIEDVAHDAWQLAGTWVLTGEAATDGNTGIRPRANFDFGNGHYGALQVGVRYHALTIDDAAFLANLAAAGSSRKAESWTAGLNWYLTPNLKYIFNFERTVFDDNAGTRRPENGLVFRTQLNF